LGIGTSSPANKFVVSNAGANGLEINPNAGVSSGASLNGYNRSTSVFTPITYSALAHYFQTGSSPSTSMTLDSSGNLTVTGNIRTFQSASLQLLANQYTDIVYIGAGGYGGLISGILTVYSTYSGAITQNSYFCNAVGNGNAGNGISMLANGDYSGSSNLILYSRGAALGGGSYVISVYNASGTTVGITYSFAPVGQGNGASYYNSLTNNGSAGAGTGLPSGVSVVFGQNNAQVKASGVTFPATQAASTDANTLDDYEEGTWTAVISTESGTNYTITSQTSRYVKIGNAVTVNSTIVYSAVGSGSVSKVSLPFTPASPLAISFTADITGTSGGGYITNLELIPYSGNEILLRVSNINTYYFSTTSNWASSGTFAFNGTFII
jgi:hypothetical protein